MPAHPDKGSKRSRCMKLYAEGKRPSDPEVKALGIPRRVTYRYFQAFKRSDEEAPAAGTPMPDINNEDGQDTEEDNCAAGNGSVEGDGDGHGGVVDITALEEALSSRGGGNRTNHPITRVGGRQTAVAKTRSTTLQGAVQVVVTPRAFTMSSILLWQAMTAAINSWGWPIDMTPEEFLDRYLYISFRQRGIKLGAYTEERENKEEADDDGN